MVQKIGLAQVCTVCAAEKNFFASNIHEINHSATRVSMISAITILCCGFFVLGCDAATEKTFHLLSHEVLFLAVASSVSDLNYLLNRVWWILALVTLVAHKS